MSLDLTKDRTSRSPRVDTSPPRPGGDEGEGPRTALPSPLSLQESVQRSPDAITPTISQHRTLHICHPSWNDRIHTVSATRTSDEILYTFLSNRAKGHNYSSEPHILIYTGNPPRPGAPPRKLSFSKGIIDFLPAAILLSINGLPFRMAARQIGERSQKRRIYKSAAFPGKELSWKKANMGDLKCVDQNGIVMAKFVVENLKPGKLGKVDFEPCARERGELGALEIVAMALAVIEIGRKQEFEAAQRLGQGRGQDWMRSALQPDCRPTVHGEERPRPG